MYSVFENLLKLHNERPVDVARATGINQTVFSEWKKGKSTPKDDKRRLIAQHFGVSLDYLDTGLDSEKSSITGKVYHFSDEAAEMAQELTESPHMRALFDAARGARPEDLKMAADMLRRFKKSGQEPGPDS